MSDYNCRIVINLLRSFLSDLHAGSDVVDPMIQKEGICASCYNDLCDECYECYICNSSCKCKPNEIDETETDETEMIDNETE